MGQFSPMQRSVLVIKKSEDDDKVSDLVWKIADTYADPSVTAVAWSEVDELPDWMSVSLKDQMHSHRRDTPDSTYLLVWLGSDEEIEALTDDE